LVGKSKMNDRERDWILSLLPDDGSVLEIGTHHGVTASYWAAKRPDLEVISVDPFRDGHMAASGSIEYWRKNAQDNQALYIATSVEFLNQWDWTHAFDAVFVDGDHSFKWCSIDLQVAKLLVTDTGLIMAHDHAPGPNCKPVRRAVKEFCAEGFYEMVEKEHRTAVMRRKK